MRWVMLLCLLLAGCTGPYTTRYVATNVTSKSVTPEWMQMIVVGDVPVPIFWPERYFISTEIGEMEVKRGEYHRIVPGVPVSVCETLDSNGKVVRRDIARRKD